MALWLRMITEPSTAWRWRDDAVITLSHARNWVEFGTVGVSPGDRVEGFSAPLQFLLASGAFSIFPVGFETFLDTFVLLFLFLTGAFIAGTVIRVVGQASWSRRKILALSAFLTLATVVPVAASWTVSGWLASGMENPLIAAILAALAFVSVGPLNRTSSVIALGVLVALLGMTRIEMPVLLLPLLLALVWLVRQGRWWILLVIPAITWSIFHILRWITYGEVLPNTAIVQGKSAGNLQIIALVIVTAAMVALLAVLWKWASDRKRLVAVWSVLLIFLVVSLVYVLVNADGEDTWFGPYWMPDPGYLAIWLMLIVLAVAQLLRIQQTRDLSPWAPELVFAAVALLPITQFLVMGPARLDVFRVASLAIPMLALWIAVTVARTLINGGTRAVASAAAVGLTGLIASAWIWVVDAPRALCCDITESQVAILDVADEIRISSLNSQGLPIIANPDLGKLSFTKRGLIIDLGLLGDPLLTRIMTERPDLMPTYMNEVAAPDVLEMHGGWACDFDPWVQTTYFEENWTLTDSPWSDATLLGDPACPTAISKAIWKRSTGDAEYALTVELLRSENPAAVAQQAIAECSALPGSIYRCQGVRRAVQRAAQALRESGDFSEVVEALAASPTYSLDKELLTRGPGWARRAFEEFQMLVS